MRKSNSKEIDTPRARQLAALLTTARQLRQDGKLADAGARCYEVLQLAPDHVEALQLMASMAMQTGATDMAIASLERALAISPQSPEILIQLGEALLANRRAEEALATLKRALSLRAKDGTIFRLLGQAQLDLGRRDDALKSFRKALSIIAYDSYSAHMVAALSGEVVSAAQSYVPALFDHYAGLFDEHLTGTLEYRVPQVLLELVQRHHPGPIATALDLGCGTGLVGEAFRGVVGAMDGVDIAPEMVRKAREREIYRNVVIDDVTQALETEQFAGPYELVTAADVFIYLGPLETVFARVATALRSGGLFGFSIETATGSEAVEIRSSGRFAHADVYVTDLAAGHGFSLLERLPLPIRQERNRPIDGAIYLLQRN